MSLTLQVTKRTGKPEVTRSEGLIPAVVYGPHIESQSIAVPYTAFEKAFEQAGESSVIDLDVEGGDNINVVVKDMQFDPVKARILHVDFRHIKMDEVMEVSVPLVFAGDSQAVKEGGTLMKNIDSIQVKGLPGDMIDQLEIDLAKLVDFDIVITVADLKLPEGLEITDDPTTLVVKVIAPVSEEQLAAMEEEASASVEDIEVEEKGKKEDGEEGEAQKEQG